jgi:hypothetical protein
VGVLDDMTKGITERKSAKAGANLTPVGVEASGVKPSLTLPNDTGMLMSNEALAQHRDYLRKAAADMLAIADGIAVLVGDEAETAAAAAKTAATEAKLAEREADRKAADREAAAAGDKKAAKRVEDSEEFEARMQRLQKEAQAAVFTASDDAPKGPVVPATPADGWVCPEHGAEDIEELSSRLRPAGYLACAVAGCGEFEPKE